MQQSTRSPHLLAMRVMTVALCLAALGCPWPTVFRCDESISADCDAGVHESLLGGPWQLRITAVQTSMPSMATIRVYQTMQATEDDAGVTFDAGYCQLRVDRDGAALTLRPNQACTVLKNTQLVVDVPTGPGTFGPRMNFVTNNCYAIRLDVTVGSVPVSGNSLTFSGRGAVESGDGNVCTSEPHQPYDFTFELSR